MAADRAGDAGPPRALRPATARSEADKLAGKVAELRIFDDAEGQITSRSADDREILCVSQFTLYGDARKGNWPSFTRGGAAANRRSPSTTAPAICSAPRGACSGPAMEVALVNDGPVTVMMEV